MACHRLVGRPVADIDLAILRWCGGVVRSRGSIWVSVATADSAQLRRELALCGIGMVEEGHPEPPADHVLTLASDLRPTSVPAVETIRLERLPLDEATREILDGRFRHRVIRRDRVSREAICRALLHGRDGSAWWDRRAWLPRGSLRDAAVRGRFRPVVFDRAALAAPRRAGLVRASDGAITRWAFP